MILNQSVNQNHREKLFATLRPGSGHRFARINPITNISKIKKPVDPVWVHAEAQSKAGFYATCFKTWQYPRIFQQIHKGLDEPPEQKA